MKHIILIAHNVRSTHNVGSLLRTAEGLGVDSVILSGYTPYPITMDDQRLPHEARKTDRQIDKTALGAQNFIDWSHSDDITETIADLTSAGYTVYGLEQTPAATPLNDFSAPEKVALIVGREVEGIEPEVLALCKGALEIPMLGKKESFNVVQAAAMALYVFRYS
jgi:23S rRNA (guanosine2251-2'-O)-methyltransferase